EKVAIARGHLWPRQVERNGLRVEEVAVAEAVLRLIVTDYTREAGVRQLERELGTLLRKTATRIASTGQTTPVAIDRAAVLHALDGRELHVHVPAGAIPKDGPSAGITMVTAIASLLTRRPVKSTVGMTGEVTLQGRVLPIGGLKQKVLAAHAAGLTEVIVPERNQPDLDDVPSDVRDQMQFHIVGSVDQVLALALPPTERAMAA